MIHHLPQEPDTLWLRLLGRGRVQQRAIAEVLALAEADPMALRVLELLLNWKIMLDEKQEALKAEERELVMNLSPAYLKWKEETLQEGIQIGEQRGEAELTLHLLRLKLGPLPSQVEAQIRALSIPQLHQLADQFLQLDSPDSLTQWLAEHSIKSSSQSD